MSPVIQEASEERARERQEKRGRGAAVLAVFLLVLLLMLPVVPVLRPVKIQVGGTMVIVGTNGLPVGATGFPHPGLDSRDLPRPSTYHGTRDMEGISYTVNGPLHFRTLRVGAWVYYLAWFRGRRS
jgi:hypothetical protein